MRAMVCDAHGCAIRLYVHCVREDCRGGLMGPVLLAIQVALVVLAVVQAGMMVLQAWEHHRFARSRLGKLHACRPSGRAMIFAPCKGVDVDLEQNLGCLFRQDYDDYAITFIVEAETDPAYEAICRLMDQHPRISSRLVVAGRAADSGQKVHNLRVATERLSPDIAFLVFVDSDAHPRREWLRALVGRLGDSSNTEAGAATGYRWLIPSRPTLANHLLYGVNCGIAALFGSKGFYPVWGGSWAIRREVFESIGLRDQWKETLSDDLVASNVLRRHKRTVKFEPAAMVTSPMDGGLRQTFSFIRRQYLIGRFHTPAIWTWGLAAAVLSNVAWWSTVAALAWMLASGAAGVWIPAASCAALYAVNVVRTSLRQRLVAVYCPELASRLRRARRFDIWAWPLVNLANGVGIFASMVGRHITWRGITYRLSAGGRIEIARREEDVLPRDAESLPIRRRVA